MTEQVMFDGYEIIQFRLSFSHFSNLAKNMRKTALKNIIFGPLGKRHFGFYSVFLMFE